jgi:hypothetical protein
MEQVLLRVLYGQGGKPKSFLKSDTQFLGDQNN